MVSSGASEVSFDSLVELLRRRARQQGDRRAYTFLTDGESDDIHWTYGELDRRARAIGAVLQQLDAAGERALLLYPASLDYVAAFFGCLYAGTVAVPAYPPRPNRPMPRIRTIVADARATVALTTRAILDQLQGRLGELPDLEALTWRATDQLDAVLAEGWRDPLASGETLAFLQYTSGSTATPKGVMVSHGNLLHNEELIRSACEHSEETPFVSWLPLYHDLGLIGNLIQSLYIGASCTLMSPVSFLQRPIRWLEAISRCRAHTSGGPNFAYDLCVRKIAPEQRAALDLSSWEVAFNGAEPVRPETLERFAEVFGPCGFRRQAFYPCYGMAETTLIVSGGTKRQAPVVERFRSTDLERHQAVAATGSGGGRPLVGCGRALGDLEIAVVHPESLHPCAPGEVGEIWVSGASVCQGYWRRREETDSAFRAMAADGGGPCLRTGDLGFLRHGELFVTGRLKDLIIIRGQNHYPQDIEATVGEIHPALRPGCGAAFAVEIDSEEHLVVVQEVARVYRDVDITEVAGVVRQAIAEEHELRLHALVLIRQGSLPKTSSGKAQRRKTRQSFLDGDLSVVAEWLEVTAEDLETDAAAPPRTAEDIEGWLIGRLSARTGIAVAAIDPHRSLLHYGLDSLAAIELFHGIETRFAVSPSLDALFEGRSIARLARDLRARVAGEVSAGEPALAPASRPVASSPLSHGQRALWFLYQLEPSSSAYNIASAAAVQGDLDVTDLRRAFATLVDRHANLRTTFDGASGEPVARISETGEARFEVVDATSWGEPVLSQRLGEAAAEPFDLERGPLLRVTLFTRPADPAHVLLLVAHHMVSDFWSLAVMVQELSEAYRAARDNRPATLPPLQLDYSDYVRWQNELLEGPAGERLWSFWRQQLAGELPTLELPTDRPRPPVQTTGGGAVRFILGAAATARLQSLGHRHEATLFITLSAAFEALLHRFSGQCEILVGSPTAGRHRTLLAGLVGYFVNPIVLRSRLAGDPSFTAFLAAAKSNARAALEHQEYPFATLVQRLQPARDASRSPLFQTMFSLQTAPRLGDAELTPFAVGEAGARAPVGDLVLESLPLAQRIAQFDLSLSMGEVGDTLAALLDYNLDLFDPATVGRLAKDLETLLEGVASDPGRRLSELPILTRSERVQLLLEWNDTPDLPLSGECVHQLLQARAAHRGDNLAVVFEGRELTYRDLDHRVRVLARRLRALGVGPEEFVGLYCQRSLELVVGIFGILAAGGAFVPLDPEYPEERLLWTLRDAGVKVLLAREGATPPPGALPGDLRVITVESNGHGPVADEVGPGAGVSAANAACLIYTSGSTGNPKGVVIEHLNLVHLIDSFVASYQPTAADRILPVTAITSASFVGEILPALATGGAVVLPTADQLLDFVSLVELISRHGVSILSTVPAVVAGLNAIQDQLPELRLLLSGGDALPAVDVERLLAAIEVVNGYGLTETTVCSTIHRLAPDELDAQRLIPIGRPLFAQQIYILDSRLRPRPVGCPGEIFIGGRGVTRGYLHRPAPTAARFLPHPAVPGGRLYRTGDRARWLADGRIEFLGRADRQVQIRGFRIELGEIESALRRHPAMQETTVVARRDDTGASSLAAYVVFRTGDRRNTGELLSYLREKLPDYMVPACFVALDNLPLLPNGKVDLHALPAPTALRPELETAYAAPVGDLERAIATVWREVLGVERPGVDDNFFDLGGHSLLLARVHARLKETLGRELSLIDLFKHPTIGSLAESLSRGAGGAERKPVGGDRVVAGRRGGESRDRAIAIVGLAGRFPGAGSVEELWRNLENGVDSITFFSDEELIEAGIDGELVEHPNYVKAKGILGDVDLFDAQFFGHNPRVAELMDPQHRVFLECAWEALENAGYDAERYAGRIGVFAGQSMNTYWLNNLYHHIDLVASVDSLEAAIGNDKDSLTTEVSYRMNLKGPSVNVQSSSSTSLTAVHYACCSLLHHESEMALAGGVSIHLPEKSGYFYHQGGTTAPDGRCRTFDAEAKGFVSGHGAGVVVLKRLSDALAAGDAIRAVIKGSACNNDGSLKVSYMAPSVDGHAEAVAQAQAAAGVSARSIGYLEAHGTGTLMGDPIEIAALTQAFRRSTEERGFCAIGSLKTNIGHLDAAAGVAGLLKATLCLERRQIPPSLHFSEPNPKIDFASSPFFVNDRLRPWERPGSTPRRAGVSSLGMGGTNTHVVLEEAPAAAPSGPSRPVQLLLLSARSASALDAASARLAAHLGEDEGGELADVAYTLEVGRKVFQHRRMVVATEREDASAALATLDPERVLSAAPEPGHRSLVFLFSGQGAQYPDMGRGLYDSEPVFRREVDRCCELLRADPRTHDLDLLRAIYPGSEPAAAEALRQTAVAQPALFTVEYALAALWREWGCEPEAMIGHSIGEYVAACLAGVFSLKHALRLVAARGRLMQSMPAGDMLAVSLPEEELELGQELALAAVNRPGTCVVSGPPRAVAALAQELAARGAQSRALHTSHAFHSAMMEPILEPFITEVSRVELRPPQMPYVSSLTGTWIRAEEATDPEYWARHLRSTVRFAAGVGELLRQAERIFLEVGPGHALTTAVTRHPERRPQQVALPSLRHPKQRTSDSAFVLSCRGRLWLAGVALDGDRFYAHQQRRRVALPTYPFERRRFWVEPGKPVAEDGGRGRAPSRVADWLHVPVWKRSTVPISVGEEAWAAVPSRWWVLADAGDLGQRIAERLAAAGQEVITVVPGEAFVRAGPDAYAIRPRHRADYEALLEALGSPEKILHLWSVTGTDPGVEQALERGFYSLLALAKACGRRRGDDALDVLVVSDLLQEVTGDEALAPAKAPLLGPCGVISRELPNLTCRSLDVVSAASSDGDLAAAILSEAGIESPDPVVAHRGAHRWVRVFERAPSAGGGVTRLRQGGTYLITGGLGGLGLAVAEHLARTVAAKLVLVGRTRLPARELWAESLAARPRHAASDKIRRIEALENLGAEVLVLSADVADRQETAEAIGRAEERFGPVHGVIHAAGVAGGGLIQLQTDEIADGVLAPKVRGALVLDEIFSGKSLDFLMLFSSVTAILGQLGQADYAAANAFLDAFAHQRTMRRGAFTVAVNWDAWREVGMAVTTEVPEELRGWRQESLRQGFSPEQGVAAFDLVLRGPWPQVVVSRQDFQSRLEEHSAAGALAELEQAAEPRAAHSRPGLANAYVPPRSDVERQLAGIWGELLGIDEVGIHDNFFDLGGNSLIGLKLTARIKQEMAAELTPVSLFEGPTVSALAGILSGKQPESAPEGRSRGEKRRARRSHRRQVEEPG